MTTTEQDYNSEQLKNLLIKSGLDESLVEILHTFDNILKKKTAEATRQAKITTILQAIPHIEHDKQNSRDLGDIFGTSHRTIQLWIKDGAKDFLIEKQKNKE